MTDVSDAEIPESKHLRVSIVHNGAEVSEDVTSQLLSSPEMRELRRLMDKVDEVGDGPYNILKGQKELVAETIDELVDTLIKKAEKAYLTNATKAWVK